MNPHDPLNALFTSWGRTERGLPEHDQELRESAFSALQDAPAGAVGSAAGTGAKRPPIRLTRRGLPWLSILYGGLVAASFLFTYFARNPVTVYRSGGGGMTPSAPSAAESVSSRSLLDGWLGNSAGPVTDSREFLKTDYGATLRTRHVQELTNRIATLIRGFGGRIDSASNSDEWGSIAFALPADKLDAFRAEIQSLVPRRFLSEQTRQTNLLPQKQSIEAQRAQLQKSLSDLQAKRTALTQAHERTAGSIRADLAVTAARLAAVRAAYNGDPAHDAPLAAEEQSLMNDQAAANNRLSNENRSYTSQLGTIDASISATQDSLKGLDDQDQNLNDTVATVDGTISIQWIGIWEILDLYLPPYWFPASLLAAGIIAYCWRRRRERHLFLEP